MLNKFFKAKLVELIYFGSFCGTEPALQVIPNIFNMVKAGGSGRPLKKLNADLFYLEHPILSMFSLVWSKVEEFHLFE